MDLHEQENIVADHGLNAVAAIMSMMVLDGEELSAMVGDRLRWGYEEFGSELFEDKPDGKILQDIKEELADAIIYMAALLWKTSGEDDDEGIRESE